MVNAGLKANVTCWYDPVNEDGCSVVDASGAPDADVPAQHANVAVAVVADPRFIVSLAPPNSSVVPDATLMDHVAVCLTSIWVWAPVWPV